MDSRRKVLEKIGLTTAAAGLVVGGGHALRKKQASAAAGTATDGDLAAAEPRPAAGEAGDGPWWLLAPLTRGDHLGQGWFVAHLGAVERGASVLTLQHKQGQVARVHLCHHQGNPKGLAHTELLDMILMDGGQGDKPTDESLGRVLMGLARVVKVNELDAKGDLRDLARMQPHAERVNAYGPETLT